MKGKVAKIKERDIQTVRNERDLLQSKIEDLVYQNQQKDTEISVKDQAIQYMKKEEKNLRMQLEDVQAN